MTKNEFIQEAALRILARDSISSMAYIAEIAAKLADKVWEVCDKEPVKPLVVLDTPAGNPNGDSVQVLAKEIARIEKDEVAAKNAKTDKTGWHRKNYYQISGADVRFLNVCSAEDIKTVADLIACGRHNFRRKRNMGELTIQLVDKALESLYNIRSW